MPTGLTANGKKLKFDKETGYLLNLKLFAVWKKLS